jgi:hypothetical protein
MFRYKNYQIYFLILGLLLILRSYHSFFNLSIGEHDWTFLSIGRSLFNGNLPYLEEWVLRGPFSFTFYAGAFFFKNYIFALKTFGIISVWISCIALFQISKKLYGYKASLFSSFGLAIAASSEESFLTSEVELFILPFISFFVYFAFENLTKPSKYNIIFAGIMISLATLMRPYLGVIAILGVLIFLYSEKNKLLNIFLYVISGLAPLLVLIILYSKNSNGLEVLWSSTISAHLAYPGGRPFLIGFFLFLDGFTLKQWYPVFILSLIVPFINKKISKESFFILFLLIVIIFLFLLTRKFSNYYILVALPLMFVIVSSFFNKNNNVSNKILISFIILSCLGPLINNFSEQIKLKYRPINKQIILYNHLKDIIKEDETIFSFDNGLYILLNKELPTKISHPSDLFRNYMLRAYFDDPNYNSELELNKIINKKPNYIIMLSIWSPKLPLSITKKINDNYEVVNFINKEEIKKINEINKNYLNKVTLYKLKL